MGWLRFAQAGFFTRLFAGVFGSGILVLAGQVPVAANSVTCGDIVGLTPCYGFAHLRAAYDVPSDVIGTGETIVVIGAYHNLTVNADLHAFDARPENLLPAPPTTVPIRMPDGFVGFDGSANQKGWFQEDAVDLQMAHAIAPGANLVLVEARTSSDADILSAINFAIDNNLGDVISMSFSEAESCPTAEFLADQHAAFERAVVKGITLIAASGNMGDRQFDCTGSPVTAVATPASDPLVTAVGGSHLMPNGSEVAWADSRGASGGGFSKVYRRPAYQAPFQKNDESRGVPDVAWNASWTDATLVCFHGVCGPGYGTSLATAEWAGVVALADQAAGHRLGAVNEALYHAAKSNDASERFHSLGHGNWDAATGLGSPDVSNLIAWIALRF